MPILVFAVALFFAGMGVFALLWPARVLVYFGTESLTRDGRNEVRAVYGGFGLAVAAVLFGAWRGASHGADWVAGAYLAIAVAVFGMAAGRVASTVVDGMPGRYPWLFFAVEIVLGAILLSAFISARPA